MIPKSWTHTLAAIGVTGLAMAVAAFVPGLGHSGYLLGLAAILVCAVSTGPGATYTAAVVVAVTGPVLDSRVDITPLEQACRAGLFMVIAIAVGYWMARIRRYQADSAAAIDKLAAKQAVLQSILDTGPDAMLTIDAHGLVTRFSAAAEQLFGWGPEEVIGHNVSMLMPGPYESEHDGYIQHYLDTGERQIIGKSRKVIGLRKDGSTFPMRLHVGEFRIGDSRQFTGFVHDLSDLSEAEARTEELRSQLTHVWRLNSLGQMASVLAHELNQPLSAISNYLRGARNLLMHQKTPDEDLLTAIDQSGDQALRAGEIIRRMRAMLARDTSARTPVSLRELIMEMDPIFAMVAGEASVSIRYNLASGEDTVTVDRIQIQQVIANLARNAVDAMTDHPVRKLEILSSREGANWVVRVEDSGPGLGDKSPASLFEPLVSSKNGGMGLGLSISRTIVTDHDGLIWVEESRLGGAAFCFSVPSVSTP